MNCIDGMTIKNYTKFDKYNFFALFSISFLLILSLFSLTLSNVIANLDSNSTMTNSNSTEDNQNGTITSFPGFLDSDRRHMPVL